MDKLEAVGKLRTLTIELESKKKAIELFTEKMNNLTADIKKLTTEINSIQSELRSKDVNESGDVI